MQPPHTCFYIWHTSWCLANLITLDTICLYIWRVLLTTCIYTWHMSLCITRWIHVFTLDICLYALHYTLRLYTHHFSCTIRQALYVVTLDMFYWIHVFTFDICITLHSICFNTRILMHTITQTGWPRRLLLHSGFRHSRCFHPKGQRSWIESQPLYRRRCFRRTCPSAWWASKRERLFLLHNRVSLWCQIALM